MKPFKMFFGITIAVIFFSFMIRIAFVAFIVASIMSIIYAIYRRVKDFITYDSYGAPYFKRYRHYPSPMNHYQNNGPEPLFYESTKHEAPYREHVSF